MCFLRKPRLGGALISLLFLTPLAHAAGPSAITVMTGDMVLPAGARSVNVELQTPHREECRFSFGEPLGWADMRPFSSRSGGTLHSALVEGLNPDPGVVNHVYVRSTDDTSTALHLRYRCLPAVNPRYPRTGNLWGWHNFLGASSEQTARIDLWLGADWITPEQARRLRKHNPNVLILCSINAVEGQTTSPDDYLKDTHGNRVEVWPRTYRLNLTKPHVAEMQARLAAEKVRRGELMYDGCFFDNVFLSQSWQNHDIHGNPFPIDADGDGKPDDPHELDRKWRAGVLHEIEIFRTLMPHALVLGHALDFDEPVIRRNFNGISIGFDPPNVIEGRRPFRQAFDSYTSWMTQARAPRVSMVESAIPNQIAYGYGYNPIRAIPPATLAFARDYYPYMRFGLGFTLLNDGYYTHEIGDTDHGQNWWYDELDFDLGPPRGPAERLGKSGPDELAAHGFEREIPALWRLQTDNQHGYTATLRRVTGAEAGTAPAACVDITATGREAWRLALVHFETALRKDTAYELRFRARSDRPRSIGLSLQKDRPEWDNYGLDRKVNVGTEWAAHVVAFTSTVDTRDARLQFFVGGATGNVWLADVSLREVGPELYRRDFEHGVVLLNATRAPHAITVGPGFSRLDGRQAPRVQFILDDDSPAFHATGNWRTEYLDSGEWKSRGPYFHEWGKSCRTSTAPGQSAEWTLPVPHADRYHIEAWWPAAPGQPWSRKVRYEVVLNDRVQTSADLDQHEEGDRWHAIGDVKARPGDHLAVRVRSLDVTPCVADAIHVTSGARYNDGRSAETVDLAPMDAIILRRDRP